MMRKLLVLIFAAVLAVVMFGCEGEQGPQGPAGPAGQNGQNGQDITADPYTYIGNDGEECGHCHGEKVDGWSQTRHSNAYNDLSAEDQDNPYCVQCHTTGFDAEVTYGDTSIVSPGPDIYGFDDYFGVEGDTAQMRREALAGVQCEACHGALGPFDLVAAHRAKVGIATYLDADSNWVSTCYPCHERQLTEWSESGHGMAAGGDLEAFREEHYAGGSCAPCHTTEGYLQAHDPAWLTTDFTGEYTFIGCVACHDPHSRENTEYQLRTIGDVYVQYHPGYDPEEEGQGVLSGYYGGQTCAQCHHARYDTESVQAQIDEGTSRFGPHHGPQMDMFIGWGCYEVEGYDYERETVHQSATKNDVSQGCVTCHMTRYDVLHGEEGEHVYHQFAPEGAACHECHAELEPGDFDRNGVQTATEALMNELAVALGYTDWVDFFDNINADNQNMTVQQREAAYALVFVCEDGSRGIHNSAYSHDLLQNALDYLNSSNN